MNLNEARGSIQKCPINYSKFTFVPFDIFQCYSRSIYYKYGLFINCSFGFFFRSSSNCWQVKKRGVVHFTYSWRMCIWNYKLVSNIASSIFSGISKYLFRSHLFLGKPMFLSTFFLTGSISVMKKRCKYNSLRC